MRVVIWPSLAIELAEVCEVVIELYYQEVWLVLDNIYMRICLVHNHVTDQGLPIQHSPQTLNQSEHSQCSIYLFAPTTVLYKETVPFSAFIALLALV